MLHAEEDGQGRCDLCHFGTGEVTDLLAHAFSGDCEDFVDHHICRCVQSVGVAGKQRVANERAVGFQVAGHEEDGQRAVAVELV